MKKFRLFSLAVIAVFALVFMASPAFAVGLQNTRDCGPAPGQTFKGAIIMWNCGWQYDDYDLQAGDRSITMTVTWTVDAAGVNAEYVGFDLKAKPHPKDPTKDFTGFTPRGKDPATGGGLSVDDSNAATGSVDVTFSFTNLHYDKRRDVDVGSAHFRLVLRIDEDDNGFVPDDPLIGFGVNLHAEDCQPGTIGTTGFDCPE